MKDLIKITRDGKGNIDIVKLDESLTKEDVYNTILEVVGLTTKTKLIGQCGEYRKEAKKKIKADMRKAVESEYEFK